MTTTHVPLTRDGEQPNRAGRPGVASAISRLLEHGCIVTDPDSNIDAEQVRSWATRLGRLASDLADCVELPTRNRVMEALYSPSVPDHVNALYIVRLNVAGMSPTDLGAAAVVSTNTISNVERGCGCQVKSAAAIADPFALGVLELFDHERDSLTVRIVGELREAITSPTAHWRGA